MCSELTHACQNAARRATGLESGVLPAGDARCAANRRMRTMAPELTEEFTKQRHKGYEVDRSLLHEEVSKF